MKYSGYSPTLHALTVKRYKPRMSLTPDMWDLWWRSMSDEERQAEHDELMAHETVECPVCNCRNGHSLTCPALGVVPVLELKAIRPIQAQ